MANRWRIDPAQALESITICVKVTAKAEWKQVPGSSDWEETGNQKVNRDGVPMWEISVVSEQAGTKPEIIGVDVPSKSVPDVMGKVVSFHGLTMGAKARTNFSGGADASLSYMADAVSVRTAGTGKPPTPATQDNGKVGAPA